MEVCGIILAIAFIMVNILDLSGFVEDGLQPFLFRNFKIKLKTKPFLCSYCMTHHIGVLYLLISGNLTIYYYCFLLFICWLTPIINNLMILIRDILAKITNINI